MYYSMCTLEGALHLSHFLEAGNQFMNLLVGGFIMQFLLTEKKNLDSISTSHLDNTVCTRHNNPFRFCEWMTLPPLLPSRRRLV